jgi:uncharacterized metal-binding protein YceD (DUF177 family)
MTPELHRPLAVDRIGASGIEVTVEATQDERAALAARMQLPAILEVTCRFRLIRVGAGIIQADGWLHARLTQVCVVSLDEFAADLAERFAVRFVPAGTESDDPDPESDDELPIVDGLIDLGEAAAEQLALALDPYPRKPGAELPDLPEDAEATPFAKLAALRNRH